MTDDEIAFDRLKGRCRICEESGCWEWTGGYTSGGVAFFHFPGSRANRRSMQAYKAAFLLSGKTIPKGFCVYRKHCLNSKCVNPDHCGVGTRKMIGAYIAKRGAFKNVPARIVANMKNRESQIAPEPLVRQIEERLARGERRVDIVDALSVSRDLVTSVKQGRHFHCRPKLVRGASVFAL